MKRNITKCMVLCMALSLVAPVNIYAQSDNLMVNIDGETVNVKKLAEENGVEYPTLTVEDRGNPSNRTKYWIDIYFGLRDEAYTQAINYGVKSVSYYYYY